jgi:ATP-dependent DNA ligase
MRLADLVRASGAVGRTSARLGKVALLADAVRALAPEERATGVAWLSGELPQGRIGVGWATLRGALEGTAPASEPALSVADAGAALGALATVRGAGSAAERARLLGSLLGRATEEERDFLVRLLGGELRQGALEGVLAEAVARAAGVSAADVRRAAMMAGALPPVAEAALAEGAAGLARFRLRLLRRGHEGVMVKALGAPYEAGRRGASWRKVKRAHTLDLVVLAAEWGHGRRRGFLSNLHLGARDEAHGGFAMLGKTFKGMTDAMLAWQTERLSTLALGESDGGVVHVRPELVVEVAFDGIQGSARHPSGLALRFARVKRYRTDKGPEQADTVDAVRALFLAQGARDAGAPP